jgi:hypothetical protein
MRILTISIVCCAACLLFCPGPVTADERPPNQPLAKAAVFTALRENIRPFGNGGLAYQALDGREKERVDKQAKGMGQAVEYLHQLSRDQDVPPPYLLSLTQDAWLLEKSGEMIGKEEKKKGLLLLEVVAADLETKRASARASGGNLTLVRIIAETKDVAGQAVNGYEVYAVQQGMIDYPPLYLRFGKLSTPTDEEAAPGDYFMWAEKQHTKGKRIPVKVRNNGTGKKDVDVPIP